MSDKPLYTERHAAALLLRELVELETENSLGLG